MNDYDYVNCESYDVECYALQCWNVGTSMLRCWNFNVEMVELQRIGWLYSVVALLHPYVDTMCLG